MTDQKVTLAAVINEDEESPESPIDYPLEITHTSLTPVLTYTRLKPLNDSRQQKKSHGPKTHKPMETLKDFSLQQIHYAIFNHCKDLESTARYFDVPVNVLIAYFNRFTYFDAKVDFDLLQKLDPKQAYDYWKKLYTENLIMNRINFTHLTIKDIHEVIIKSPHKLSVMRSFAISRYYFENNLQRLHFKGESMSYRKLKELPVQDAIEGWGEMYDQPIKNIVSNLPKYSSPEPSDSEPVEDDDDPEANILFTELQRERSENAYNESSISSLPDLSLVPTLNLPPLPLPTPIQRDISDLSILLSPVNENSIHFFPGQADDFTLSLPTLNTSTFFNPREDLLSQNIREDNEIDPPPPLLSVPDVNAMLTTPSSKLNSNPTFFGYGYSYDPLSPSRILPLGRTNSSTSETDEKERQMHFTPPTP